MTNVNHVPKQTAAFVFQAWMSFALSFGALLFGIAYLPLDPWMRAFLAMGVLYVVTSTFTLAKTVRDVHEQKQVLTRVDEARMTRFIEEHDPFASTL